MPQLQAHSRPEASSFLPTAFHFWTRTGAFIRIAYITPLFTRLNTQRVFLGGTLRVLAVAIAIHFFLGVRRHVATLSLSPNSMHTRRTRFVCSELSIVRTEGKSFEDRIRKARRFAGFVRSYVVKGCSRRPSVLDLKRARMPGLGSHCAVVFVLEDATVCQTIQKICLWTVQTDFRTASV